MFCSGSIGTVVQEKLVNFHEWIGCKLCDKCDGKNHRMACQLARNKLGLFEED